MQGNHVFGSSSKARGISCVASRKLSVVVHNTLPSGRGMAKQSRVGLYCIDECMVLAPFFRGENAAPDVFGNRRDHRVTYPSKALHWSGNPIRASANRGLAY